MASFKSLFVAGALMALGLSACKPYPQSGWTPMESPPVENQVRWIESSHVVRFTAGEPSLSPGERGRLEAFLGVARPDSTDRIAVLADESALDARRAANVRDYLLERRVLNKQIIQGSAADDGPNTVRVVVGRYIVIPPACPNWSKSSAGDSNNRSGSNFGCATTTNLGAMVADPGDLVAGKAIGPGDATVSAGSVQRYREDSLKELPNVSTRNSQQQ